MSRSRIEEIAYRKGIRLDMERMSVPTPNKAQAVSEPQEGLPNPSLSREGDRGEHEHSPAVAEDCSSLHILADAASQVAACRDAESAAAWVLVKMSRGGAE
ncbi:uncharacterized protein E0L32_004392 [Thyridium curvatum]|uniref:Uncharacterized protein n=1 Tax=Thyridium curvatum TaxID=1093900 RepID=A0A507AZJ8_9PEZI|nr:uncharacterized protein E0L32_004392 [Thyridium curvatum]TPX15412.1 hypothetical protein E0L32_004392 [Thyridium curvatum]